ncbi:sigma-54-dependent Fis family transcriptional regulator [Neoehrlichia mikurensis]|uniref:Putative response regulator NtrX-like n=1 Tax=Neoehrlichia mikurensis TaxID=89586 RepID=A0A9Q9BTK9_9RICK|nr:sigma-54 dependent transcriptional regulator [Neoehrlichia mikurensis]QXK91744.1 sigma-54-dependent Fis family transcriptional regulator [Neoehrlichia mikurensis]QXK92956.1 sigma-54-dependent Fis family transcriptional regulator [Neoehrlichia mikurensis]QXK93434.1 sigma-54-dependent Fis family transcriptional regulator [Neoehrlichia mikurensis]UTO55612.1 sigma-54 dependent transcriptional regulator [Neoehrlichia mikurensis]UTO56533.1 sigma-54 dependent transcriptional regulator [Neoehrlichi
MLKAKRFCMSEVLVVDDEADIRNLIKDILSDENYSTKLSVDGLSAIKLAYEKEPDVVLLDIWLKGSDVDGLGVLEKLKERYPYLPVIMISGHGSVATAVKSLHRGAYDYIEKPFTESRLKLVVKRAIESGRLRKENDKLKASFEDYEFIGSSPVIKNLRNIIHKASMTSSRVLITGASGTGKEVVARLIHQKSKGCDTPFVNMCPSMMPTNNYLANIFGSEECGNFLPYKLLPNIGIVEQANRGTLFIDEVTDIRYDAQLRLLRLLQEGKIYRENGKMPVVIDARVIASSSKVIKDEVKLGRFCEDLYYRLNVLPIVVPSLYEYCSDIPEICQYFMKSICKKMGLANHIISNDAIIALQSYSWPGNLRQLRNVLEWVLIMKSSEGIITVEDLPVEIISRSAVNDTLSAKMVSIPLRQAREEFERQYLKTQLSRFGGSVSKTAEFIGMERSALHRKLKVLGLYNVDVKAN